MDETKPQGKAWEYDPAKLIGITNHFPTVNGNMFYSPLSLFLHILRTSIYFLQELLFEDGPTKRTGQNAIIWSSLNMIISGASLRGWWQNNGKSMRQWSETQNNVVSKKCRFGTHISGKLVWIRTFLSRDFNQLISKCFSIAVMLFKMHPLQCLMLFLPPVSCLGSALLFIFSFSFASRLWGITL